MIRHAILHCHVPAKCCDQLWKSSCFLISQLVHPELECVARSCKQPLPIGKGVPDAAQDEQISQTLK
jgi:hypothetical protein